MDLRKKACLVSATGYWDSNSKNIKLSPYLIIVIMRCHESTWRPWHYLGVSSQFHAPAALTAGIGPAISTGEEDGGPKSRSGR
jgi:hypothetical protein